MRRSIAAVLAGFIVMAVLVMAGTALAASVLAPGGTPTTPYLAANLTISFVAALTGGFLAARIARRNIARHVFVLAAIMLALGLPGLFAPAPGQPVYYPAVVLALGVTGVLLGGLVLAPRSARATAAPAV